MKKILVVYQSKTGFTKKYAEWIAQKLSADIKAISKINISEINSYDIVIFGGWIMGGMISGLDKVRNCTSSKLIVFGVGFTDKKEVDISKMKEANKLTDHPFFYLEGGIKPKEMGFVARTMVKLATKKPLAYVDNTNRDNIVPIIKAIEECI